MPETPSALICVAAIAGAFGVKGEVKIKSFTENLENCMNYGPLLNEAGLVVLTPESYRVMKGFIAVSAFEVKSREAAEALKSTQLFVPRKAFPDTGDEDFYYSDLIGLDVKSTDGRRVGKIVAIHEFGAGDMLEIEPYLDKKTKKQQASFYHPFTKLATPKVDIEAGRVIIDFFNDDRM